MLRRHTHEAILAILTLLAILILSLQSEQFLTGANLLNQLRLLRDVALVALVMTFVIATLGTLALYRGLAECISQARSVRGLLGWFARLGQGDWLGLPVEGTRMAVYAASGVVLIGTLLASSLTEQRARLTNNARKQRFNSTIRRQPQRHTPAQECSGTKGRRPK